MNVKTLLELGRVSNLPTVWSNILCGAVLAHHVLPHDALSISVLAPLLLAATLLYVGGMWLNDAFDAEWDRQHRPERPIPSGRISRDTVLGTGLSLLAASCVLSAVPGLSGGSYLPVACALTTVGCILLYNRFHKGYPWAPLVMGACRVGLYAMAAFSFTSSPPALFWVASLALWAYVVGLTHVARFETGSRLSQTWVTSSLAAPALVVIYGLASASFGARDWWLAAALTVAQVSWIVFAVRWTRQPRGIPRAVVSLIAGISLVDAALLALCSAPLMAAGAVACFALTLLAQRVVSGT